MINTDDKTASHTLSQSEDPATKGEANQPYQEISGPHQEPIEHIIASHITNNYHPHELIYLANGLTECQN